MNEVSILEKEVVQANPLIEARKHMNLSEMRLFLLGLQGIVIKSHGNADIFAFANAINVARLEITNGIIDHIRCQLDRQQKRSTAEEPTA